MSDKSLTIPAGEGLEADYDFYEKKPRRHYKTSQEWWEAFANSGIEEWTKCEYQDELLKLVDGDIHLAMVIHHFIGENFSEWMHRKDIPALGALSPIECLKNQWSTKRLRMLFFQFR